MSQHIQNARQRFPDCWLLPSVYDSYLHSASAIVPAADRADSTARRWGGSDGAPNGAAFTFKSDWAHHQNPRGKP